MVCVKVMEHVKGTVNVPAMLAILAKHVINVPRNITNLIEMMTSSYAAHVIQHANRTLVAQQLDQKVCTTSFFL